MCDVGRRFGNQTKVLNVSFSLLASLSGSSETFSCSPIVDTRNPHPRTAEVIDEGLRLYAGNCASCHGTKGMGDGDAGKALNPSPALLAYMIQMPMSVDA
jgi:mono/diheme cytochrome c family protein